MNHGRPAESQGKERAGQMAGPRKGGVWIPRATECVGLEGIREAVR